MTTDAERRRAYAEAVAPRGTRAIIDAFAAVPRERFVGDGPWQIREPSGSGYVTTPDASLEHIYRDVLVALDPAKKLNNGQPSAHAKWLTAASPMPGESVLHVGCGTGYFTAILAELVGERGHVVAYEVEPELVTHARENLAPWPWASVIEGDASEPRGEYDAIYVNAGATHARPEWLDALRPGGRLVVPLTADGKGMMFAIVAGEGDRWPVRIVTFVGFYDCVGAREPDEEPQIAALMTAPVRPMVLTRAPHARGEACLIHAAASCIQRAG
jgi:protein-L-isoaspartate(D-aspartate) O-methyltransferase